MTGALWASDVTAEADAKRSQMEFFENQIRPLLAERCYSCHGDEKQKGGLRLDSLQSMLHGGDSGAAVVAGKPEDSLMIESIRYQNEDIQMPPKEKLSDKEIALLEKWVSMGAPWPQAKGETAETSARDADGFTKEERAQWVFQPLANPTPPALPGNTWVRNDVDRFVAEKHKELGISAAEEAAPRELLRRVYFDLTGLPPTLEEIEAFAKDPSDLAYAQIVDKLLLSPAYGERWAQHWLDLTRFAESDGYNADSYRPSAWPYRDWVVRAFNADMPYDEFVKKQLAGDEMDMDDPETLVATSFLRNGIYEWNQRDVRGQRQLLIEDMTDTAGELFFGLSMGCARCHNHKFDPILQTDYYRLQAFFTPVNWRSDLKLATKEEKAEYERKLAIYNEHTKEIRAEMDAMAMPLLEKRKASAKGRFRDDIEVMMEKDPKDRTALEHQLASIAYRQVIWEEDRFIGKDAIKDPKLKKRYLELEEQLKPYAHLRPAPLMDAFVATDAKREAPPTILKTRKGEQDVQPGFLKILEPNEPTITPIGDSTGRRTVLANWITKPDNQITTRAIVNRVWNFHFGRALSGVPSDMGNLGEAPTHPELLDWLSRQFVSNGWSFKKLHKQIVLSSTYRQTALRMPDTKLNEIDPGNKFLWRFHPRRLDAEQARDAMLMASGELNLSMGGEVLDSKATRRSMYVTKKRNNQDEFLRSLDAPAGFISVSERQSTTTPTQALYMMNGDWVLTRARMLASRVKTVEDAWSYTLGRAPTPEEKRVATDFIVKRAGGSLVDTPEGQVLNANPGNGAFKPGSNQERLLVKNDSKEGDEFTVEGIVTFNSIDSAASVRTIVSRWNLGKDNLEAVGWSLGVTGVKSRFKPNNLIVQLVGEDDNGNIGYEVVASDLFLKLNRPYHVVAKISCSQKKVSFRVKDLSDANSQAVSAVVPHDIRRYLSRGNSSLVVGGLNNRATSHQWDGSIDALRVVPRMLPDQEISSDVTQWKDGLFVWDAKKPLPANLVKSAGDGKSDSNDPWMNALTDLCHVLLNSNEFVYLH